MSNTMLIKFEGLTIKLLTVKRRSMFMVTLSWACRIVCPLVSFAEFLYLKSTGSFILFYLSILLFIVNILTGRKNTEYLVYTNISLSINRKMYNFR